MVEKKSFIAFMCKVINIATRQERKVIESRQWWKLQRSF